MDVLYDVKEWNQHVEKIACDTSGKNKGSAGLTLLQVDEYNPRITPLNETCGRIIVKQDEKKMVEIPELVSDETEILGPVIPEIKNSSQSIPVLVDEEGTIVNV